MEDLRYIPSASKLELAEKCAWPWSGDQKWPWDPSSPQALGGKVAHRCLEYEQLGECYEIADVAVEIGLIPKAFEKPSEYEFWYNRTCNQIVDGRLVIASQEFNWRKPELVTVYNPITRKARFIEDRKQKLPGDQVIIFDTVLELPDGRLKVIDYKFGSVKYTPPDEVPQTRLGGLVAAQLYNRNVVVVELVFFQTTGPFFLTSELDLLAMEEGVAWVSTLVRELPSRKVATPGIWCGEDSKKGGLYCPLRKVCATSSYKGPKKRIKKAS